MRDLPRVTFPVPADDVRDARFSVGARLLLVGVVAGTVLGAGVGGRSLVDDVAGLWFFGMLIGAGAGAVLGGAAAALSAAVVLPRAVTVPVQGPGSVSHSLLWWQLLVPIPAGAGAAWWVLQSPLVMPLDRLLVTAGAAAACAGWVVWTSAWVVAPLTRGGSTRVVTVRCPRVPS